MKTKKGFGFVVSENRPSGDVHISARNMNGAMHGDLVLVKIYYDDDYVPEGEIIKVLSRAHTEIIGVYTDGYVSPNDRRIDEVIRVKSKEGKGAQNGDAVIAKILKYPEIYPEAEVKITEIICRADEPGKDIKTLIRQYNLIEAFPAKVLAEAKNVSQKDFNTGSRVDLRERTIFTIDGADAKDLDDAVSVEKNVAGNFVLGVHIADVSFYVEEGSAADKEAFKRGTSVYLIDQVVPMLPPALSNGICSLNEGEDRLTVSVDMEITPKGEITSHRIYESIIRSCERMVYTDVSDILEYKDLKLIKKYDKIYKNLLLMEELADILHRKREKRGSLDFDLPETEIKLNADGIAEFLSIAERRVANRIIEEFMLIANETVAEQFFRMDVPFIYRVHEKPKEEKLTDFEEFIKNFGLSFPSPKKIHTRMLSELLKKVEGKPYESIVNMSLLRAMQKAFYSPRCDGHFGLSFRYYCHFTAPIRRYPDLMIHRIIKETITGMPDKNRIKTLTEKTEAAALNSSQTEKNALELEREVLRMKKAEYMSFHIGEKFEGVISGVKPYGVFVELANTAEGLAPEYLLPVHDFTPGDKVTVSVLSADPLERRIDFEICRY